MFDGPTVRDLYVRKIPNVDVIIGHDLTFDWAIVGNLFGFLLVVEILLQITSNRFCALMVTKEIQLEVIPKQLPQFQQLLQDAAAAAVTAINANHPTIEVPSITVY